MNVTNVLPYLLVDFPLVLNGVTSQLTHCALAEGIVQNKQLHFPESFSLIFHLFYLLVHLLNFHFELCLREHGSNVWSETK